MKLLSYSSLREKFRVVGFTSDLIFAHVLKNLVKYVSNKVTTFKIV